MFSRPSGAWWKHTTQDFFSPNKYFWQERLSNTLKMPWRKIWKSKSVVETCILILSNACSLEQWHTGNQILLASNKNNVLILVAMKKYGKNHDNNDAGIGALSYADCWVSKTCSRCSFPPDRMLLGVSPPCSHCISPGALYLFANFGWNQSLV